MTSWDDTAPPAWDDPPVVPEHRYAGFWIRVAATFLDAIVVGIPLSLVFAAAGDEGSASSQALQTLILAVYSIVLWVTWGKTVGGRIVGLRLVRVDAQPVTYGTAVVRYLMLWVSIIPLGLGLIWVAFDGKKQGWMDKVAGTYVIYEK